MTLFVAGYIAPTREACREWADKKCKGYTLRVPHIRPTYTLEPLGNSYRVTVRAA